MLRFGDYAVFVSIAINFCACAAYLYQRHYPQALYWGAALQLNLSLVWMK